MVRALSLQLDHAGKKLLNEKKRVVAEMQGVSQIPRARSRRKF